jgi:hypothetical protein
MKKSFLMWFATCLLLLVQQSALADLRFERFIPANPTADDIVQVEIWFSRRSTVPCDSPANPDFSTFLTQRPDGALRFRFPTVRRPNAAGGICSAGEFEPTRARYSLGRLAANSYQIELYAIDIDSPLRPDILVGNTALLVLPGVGGPVVSAPTLGYVGILLLSFSVLLGGFAVIKKQQSMQLIAALLFGFLALGGGSGSIAAETVEITLRAGSNRPSADSVLAAGISGNVLPQLAGNAQLRNLQPAIAQRPNAAYQRWLNDRPDHPAALMQRIINVDAPTVEAAEALVRALRLNPNVQQAFVLPKMSFAAGPAAVASQAGQTAIRADSARRWQTGWALIGTTDTGIQVNHPELRAFSSFDATNLRDSGSYTGGNFLWTYSGDDTFGGRNVDERRCVSASASAVTADPSLIAQSCRVGGASGAIAPGIWNQACAGQISASYVGHGTHQVGIAVANGVQTITPAPGEQNMDFNSICLRAS